MLAVSPFPPKFENDFSKFVRDCSNRVGLTMSMISSIGSLDVVPGAETSSTQIQLDLTEQTFQLFQDLCTSHNLKFKAGTLRNEFYRDCFRVRNDCCEFEDADPKSCFTIDQRLSIAACFGLTNYIQSHLSICDSTSRLGDILLQNALAGVLDNGRYLPMGDFASNLKSRLFTIRKIVNEKSDPETPLLWGRRRSRIHHGTLWGAFCFLIYYWLTHSGLTHVSNSIWQALNALFTELIENFLSLGANPNSRIVYSHKILLRDDDDDCIRFFEFIREQSPIAMIELTAERLNRDASQFLPCFKSSFSRPVW